MFARECAAHTLYKTFHLNSFTCRSVVKPHALFGHYMEIFALHDIEPYTELFVKYGAEYWDHSDKSETPIPRPHVFNNKEYEAELGAYELAMNKLIVTKPERKGEPECPF